MSANDRLPTGDPPLDALLLEIEDPRAIWSAIAALGELPSDDTPLPTAIPPPLDRFLASTRLPEWASLDALERGARFAERNLPYVSLALIAGSLPLLFTSAHGATVLTRTRRLLDDVDRRVNETARFVFDVLEPGAFGGYGRGVRAVQRVRLIHAAVRHAQRPTSPTIPIDQTQLLGTLFAFSVVVVRSATRLGARVTDRDREDYWHLWRVVGALLGIEARSMPHRYAEAERSLRALVHDNAKASAEGRALTAALLERTQAHLVVPDLSTRLVRYLLGERVADLLEVPTPRSGALDSRWVRSRAPALFRAVSPLLGRTFQEAVVRKKLATTT